LYFSVFGKTQHICGMYLVVGQKYIKQQESTYNKYLLSDYP